MENVLSWEILKLRTSLYPNIPLREYRYTIKGAQNIDTSIHLQFDQENADNPTENGAKYMNRHSIKKNTQMANKHIKRESL